MKLRDYSSIELGDRELEETIGRYRKGFPPYFYLYFIICLLLIPFHSLNGQSKPDIQKLLKQSHELIRNHEQDIFRKFNKPATVEVLDQFVAQAIDHYMDVYQTELELKSLGVDSIKRENGLRLSAGFYENFGEMLLTEDGVFFRRRAFVGIDWDMIQSGWFQNQLRSKALALKVKEWKDKRHEMRFHYANRYILQCVKHYFNQQKLDKLLEFKKFLQAQVSQVQYLRQLHYLPMQEEIRLKGLLQQLSIQETSCILRQNQMKRLLDFAWIYPALDQIAPFQLSLYQLVEEIQKHQLDLQLEKEQIAHLNQTYRLPYRWSAQPFIRYSYVQDANTQSRDFFTIGFNFSTPLSFKREDRLKSIRIEKLQIDKRRQVNEQLFQVLDYNHQYLAAVTDYQLKLSGLAEKREAVRIQLSQRSIDSISYSPIETIRLMTEYFKDDLALVDYQQKVIESLLPFYGIGPTIRLSDFSKPMELNDASLTTNYHKGVYLWSNAFKRHSSAFLIEYMTKHQLTTAYVSLSQNIEPGQWASFYKLAQQRNITVLAVIGNPDYIFEEKYINWQEKVNLCLEMGIKQIHLDIEPHTLPNWSNEKASYLSLYNKMIKNIRQYCVNNGISYVSFAIPMHYPDSTLAVLASNSDEVVVMAYETKNIESIQRRTQEERTAFGNKLKIAIRTKDFSSIQEFNSFAQLITNNLKLDELIVHDLESYLQLESELPDTKK